MFKLQQPNQTPDKWISERPQSSARKNCMRAHGLWLTKFAIFGPMATSPHTVICYRSAACGLALNINTTHIDGAQKPKAGTHPRSKQLLSARKTGVSMW